MFTLEDLFRPRPNYYVQRRPDSAFGPFFQPHYHNGRCGPFFRDYEEEDIETARQIQLQQQLKAREEAEHRRREAARHSRRPPAEEELESDGGEGEEQLTERELFLRDIRKMRLQEAEEEQRRQAQIAEKREDRVRAAELRQKRIEEEKRRSAAEEEARRQWIEEKQRIAEERRKKEEELRKRIEEQRRKIEEERLKRFDSAATVIQKNVRGYLSRKEAPLEPLKQIKQVEKKVEDARKRWENLLLCKVEVLADQKKNENPDAMKIDDESSSSRAKLIKNFDTTVLAFEEDMVKHLLSLDAIPTGGSPVVRDYRRSTARRIQDILADIDAIKRWLNGDRTHSPTTNSLFMTSLFATLPLVYTDL